MKVIGFISSLLFFIFSYTFSQDFPNPLNEEANPNEIVLHFILDQAGDTMGTIPLPQNWHLVPGGITSIEGTQVQEFEQSSIAEFDRLQVPTQDLVLERIRTQRKMSGDSILQVFALPELSTHNQYIYQQLYGAQVGGPSAEIFGIELIQDNGLKKFWLINTYVHRSAQFLQISYKISELSARPQNYELARQNYLSGLKQIQLSEKYLAGQPARLEVQRDLARIASLENSLYRTAQYFPPEKRQEMTQELFELKAKHRNFYKKNENR